MTPFFAVPQYMRPFFFSASAAMPPKKKSAKTKSDIECAYETWESRENLTSHVEYVLGDGHCCRRCCSLVHYGSRSNLAVAAILLQTLIGLRNNMSAIIEELCTCQFEKVKLADEVCATVVAGVTDLMERLMVIDPSSRVGVNNFMDAGNNIDGAEFMGLSFSLARRIVVLCSKLDEIEVTIFSGASRHTTTLSHYTRQLSDIILKLKLKGGQDSHYQVYKDNAIGKYYCLFLVFKQV